MKKLFNALPLAKTANWLLFASLIIVCITIPLFGHSQRYGFSLPVNNSLFGDLGSFLSGTVGSILSLASVFYFIVALKEQRKDISSNQEVQSLQRFESTFFQLLNLHVNTVNELRVNDHGRQLDGKLVFETWKNYLHTLGEANVTKNGISDMGFPTIEVTKHITEAAEYKIWLDSEYYAYYTTFENALGYYFRQLYHIFKYIYLSDLIEDEKKQFYASLLRAHLSQNELYAIAVNAVIPQYGYPKFMFLINKYDVLQNFNHNVIPEGIFWDYFNDMKAKCSNPFSRT